MIEKNKKFLLNYSHKIQGLIDETIKNSQKQIFNLYKNLSN